MARIAEKPDITLRAAVAELAERGVKVSVMAVFDFYRREGFSFKKNPARQRTRPPGRGAPARTLEATSSKA